MGAVLLAMALCLGMTPATSHAEESEAGTAPVAASSEQAVGTATLTIVYGLGMNGDPDIVVNKKYPFAEGATVEDLFAAAKAAGDIKDYAFVDGGYGSYIRSVTTNTGKVVENATDGSLYWGNFKNGAFAIDTEAQGTEALADGVSYQFAWSSYPTAAAPADWTPIVSMATDGTGMAGIGAKAGTATLTIVYGLGFTGDPDIVMNKKYEFASGATVEDLFAAAKAAGDIKEYAFVDGGYGSALNSVTEKDGTEISNNAAGTLYWGNFKNGSYVTQAGEAQGTETLADGVTYQFAWSSYPTAAAPSDWAAIIAAATDGSEIAPGKPVQKPEDSKYTPVALDSEAYAQLFSSIAGSFAGTAEPWEALDLAAIGQASAADENALVAAARTSIGVDNPTALQKNILALTALGIDATSVVGQNGTSLIDALGSTAMATSMVNGRAFALLAYKSGPYAPASGAQTEQQLIDNVLAGQLDDGGFALQGASADADITAMVIAALAPYRSDTRVETALQAALAALQNLQLADGGFPSLGAIESNVNSTAVAVIALAAAGIDPAASWAVENGATPVSALLSFANESRNGFIFGTSVNDIATEQGFRAMVAYQGFKNTGAAYNVYLQAADGVAGLPGVGPSTQTPTAPQNKLAQTGDGVAAAPIAALAVCAVTGIALAVRRRTEAVRTANR